MIENPSTNYPDEKEKTCWEQAMQSCKNALITPGMHGKRPANRKESVYAEQLREKQKVKRMYGLREEQFRRSVEKAVKSILIFRNSASSNSILVDQTAYKD